MNTEPGPLPAPEPLPRRVVVPSAAALAPLSEFDRANFAAYILGTLRALAAGQFPGARVELAEDDALAPVGWAALPVAVDGVRVVVDYGDYAFPDPAWQAHDHWLRFHYTSAFRPYPRLGPFPQQSFLDWPDYAALAAEVAAGRAREPGRLVLNNQTPGGEYDSRHRRRLLVRGMLHYHFADRCDFAWRPARDFWRAGARAACYVHVPGSTENMVDKAWAQMLGLGVPVVSPPIHGYLGTGRPLAGVHYVACRDDYADLPDRVRRCLHDPGWAGAVAAAGRDLFARHATPPAIWAAIARRLAGGRPAGIDRDLAC